MFIYCYLLGQCVFEVFYYNWCLIGGSIKIELKRHPVSKQQSRPYAMKQLGGGPKYAMTNISLPDAAGENLFKKELLMVMLVCPQ